MTIAPIESFYPKGGNESKPYHIETVTGKNGTFEYKVWHCANTDMGMSKYEAYKKAGALENAKMPAMTCTIDFSKQKLWRDHKLMHQEV